MPWPEKINVDGNSATHRGLRLLATEDRRWQEVEVRARRYLNNVVEQDHRAIKQRCAPMLGLKSFRSAAITLAGIELAHRVRKQQYSLPMGMNGRARSLHELWAAWIGTVSTKDFLRRKPLLACQASRRAVLALPVPVRRQAKDAFPRDLSGRPDRPGAVAPSRGAAVARGGRRSVAQEARTAAYRERGA